MSTSEVSFDLWFYTVTIDSSIVPFLLLFIVYLFVQSNERQASKACMSVFYLAVS